MPHALQGVRNFGGMLLLICGTVGIAHAQVLVTPIVTKTAGLYHYNYSISNTSTSDLFDLDIVVPSDAAAGFPVILNLTAPSGFVATNDSVLGIVSFLEDTGTFGTTPQNGFAFDSPLSPGRSGFTANLSPPSGGITTFSGATQAPVTPEPGSVAIIGALAASGFCAVRRKSRRK